jgi:hypothetical protein
MIARTYPTEYSTFDGDYTIISTIRDKIGDRVKLRRYYLPVGNDNVDTYIQEDNLTFYDDNVRYWPYHLTFSGTTFSGTSNPQILDYQYMLFTDPVTDLSAAAMDFWVETFYLSDFEIWTAYLNVDLLPFFDNDDCITEEMEMLKAAIDLVPSLRAAHLDLYRGKKVRDDDVEYTQNDLGGSRADPWKDLLKKLQDELNELIAQCNTSLYNDGYLIL